MKQWINILALCLAATGVAAVHADQPSQMAERISQQMSTPDRHGFDLPRDEHRKPYETFQFLG